jgi:hypothetical protein
MSPCNSTINDFSNASDDTYVCYPLLPRTATDVIPEYVVSLDPEDPIFYSTCYLREKNIEFEGYTYDPNADNSTTKNTNSFAPWRFYDKCISCNDQLLNTRSDLIPKWTLSPVCINCDIEPANNPVVPDPWVQVRNSAVCDGYGGTWSVAAHHNCTAVNFTCVKQLYPRGKPTYVRPEDCIVLARRDPECSNYVMSRVNASVNAYTCFCYKKMACCNNCSPKASTSFDLYELTPTPADPTCATGVKSSDGVACCSASCGAGGCKTGVGALTNIGFCCKDATCIKRSCKTYGPPCLL